jgi:hypothetical protein
MKALVRCKEQKMSSEQNLSSTTTRHFFVLTFKVKSDPVLASLGPGKRSTSAAATKLDTTVNVRCNICWRSRLRPTSNWIN